MGRSTRQALAAALMKRLATTPLDKVTVSALSADAGITRQTFYYHFSDTYDRDIFFLDLFRQMMEAVVSELETGLTVPAEYRQFVIDHYASVVLGHFLRWISEDVRQDPNVLVPRIERILRGTVRKALEEFSRE